MEVMQGQTDDGKDVINSIVLIFIWNYVKNGAKFLPTFFKKIYL